MDYGSTFLDFVYLTQLRECSNLEFMIRVMPVLPALAAFITDRIVDALLFTVDTYFIAYIN